MFAFTNDAFSCISLAQVNECECGQIFAALGEGELEIIYYTWYIFIGSHSHSQSSYYSVIACDQVKCKIFLCNSQLERVLPQKDVLEIFISQYPNSYKFRDKYVHQPYTVVCYAHGLLKKFEFIDFHENIIQFYTDFKTLQIMSKVCFKKINLCSEIVQS